MSGQRPFRRAWSFLLRKQDVERAVDEELELHLELMTEDLIREGLDPETARQRAEQKFGDPEKYREVCQHIGERRRQKRQVLDLLRDRLQDIRLALRSFRRTPAFFIAAVLTIALGIGAVTTMFTVVKGVLLAPLPYHDPDGIVQLTVNTVFWGESESLSEPEYMALRSESATLQDVTVIRYQSRLLQSAEPHYIRTVEASWELFPLLGIQPTLGRAYGAQEDVPGAEQIAVLNHTFWNEEFGGDPDIVGRSLIMDGMTFTVVGVMPAGFDFPLPGNDLWTPYRIDPADLDIWNKHYLGVYARISEGETLDSVQAEVNAMGDRFVRDHPDIYSDWKFSLHARQLKERVIGGAGAPLLILLGAVGFFLFIACINVANLLVARGESRGREMAVRSALGASRRRLTSQLLIESFLVAGIGGVVGLLLAVFGVTVVVRTALGVVPRLQEVSVDPGILLFAIAVTCITGLLFGLLPVLQTGRFDVQTQLREGGRSLTGRRYGSRLRKGLIIIEVTLSVVLVAGAIMMVRSLNNLQQFDLGYQTDDRLTLRVIVPSYREQENAVIQNFYADLLDRVRAMPGVENAAAIEYPLLTMGLGTWSIKVESEGTTTIGNAPGAYLLQITPDLFATLGAEMVQGRSFTRGDVSGTLPAVIVNEAFVRDHWPDGRALGRRIANFDAGMPWLEVVGVVGDMRQEEILVESYPTMYVPHAQATMSTSGSRWYMTMIIHGDGVIELAEPVQSLIREMEPTAVITDVTMMDDVHRGALADRILPTTVLSLFSTLALLLAAVGVYGLVAFFAAARRTEFGLHLALGALPNDLRRLVLAQGLYPVLVGVGCGLVLTFVLAGLAQQFLFGIDRLDPASFVMVTVVLTVMAIVASFTPAWRVSRIDPMEVLRQE
ncbi:ADOP family duplicated permease [Gemmatimonadota bacterium]